MADVHGLYLVTAIVLALLVLWVAWVSWRAPSATAIEEQPPTVRTPTTPTDGVDPLAPALSTDPSTPDREAGSEAEPAPSVPPPSKAWLNSHLEIQDSPPIAAVLVAPDGDRQTGRPSSTLAVAVGRADPLPGKSPELHAIDPRLHLFVFADGGGKRIGPKLASTIAVDEIVDAFDKDDGPGSASDANLTAQARRLRLAVLSANRALLQQARGVGYAGLGTNVFAAHFSPSNDQVVVAHVGAHRAYRVRGGSITRLTTAQGGRLLGVSDKVDVEVVTEAVHPADVYLFCAERLGRGLGDDELLALLNGAEPSIEKVARALVDASGSKDLVEEDVGQDRVAVVVRVDAAPPGSAQSSRRAKTVIGLG